MTTLSVTIMTAAALSTVFRSEVTARPGSETIYMMQETAVSRVRPVAYAGNLPHAAIFALTITKDGMIYTGQETFVASLSIEIEVMHLYKSDQIPYKVHRAPPAAVINGITKTYLHITALVDKNIITADVPTASGTFVFTERCLVFHK